MPADDEREVDPIQEMQRLMQESSIPEKWRFRESYCSVADKRLIYNSKWCRVKIVWGGWDAAVGNSISIYYGRLHAPSESLTMKWNGEECHTWHRFEHALHFLDGRSSVDAAKMNYSTPITNKYYDDEISQKYERRQPEWLLNMHLEVWKHYGEKFFELFDLRQPNLWEQYREFLKGLYDIKGRPPFIKPSLDKVC